ncbi:MAG: AAA family ATPase, partial [Proteobacteria bacterium]|nr:AAA family ATPase [Pseudomonadota bacterium]
MAKKRGRGKLRVVSRHGRFPFQTGIVTAGLMRRGLNMEQAFDVSRQLRQRLFQREEITTAELGQELGDLLDELGVVVPQSPRVAEPELLQVRTAHRVQAFPRHVLLRDLAATGLDIAAGIALSNEVEFNLRRLGHLIVPQTLVDAEILRLVSQRCDQRYARRYRLIHWLRVVDTPVVILIGGATGTGKTTLAMELAFRLGIRVALSTDMIRETMRTILSAELVPGLHDHSFRGMLQGGQLLSDARERVLAGFRQQASQVAVGISGAINRARRENTHLIIEGTHLVPPFDRYLIGNSGFRAAGFVLTIQEQNLHRIRFPARAVRERRRDPSVYLESFQAVRWIHDYL